VELNRVFPIGLVIICTPLSLLLLILWFPYAGSVWFGSFELREVATFAQGWSLARELLGAVGGFVGWVSLMAFAVMSQRPWSRIPTAVKAGCGVGVLAALLIPVAPGLALPPIVLCGALAWLSKRREADVGKAAT
jgi:hypothetical protein